MDFIIYFFVFLIKEALILNLFLFEIAYCGRFVLCNCTIVAIVGVLWQD